MAVGQGAHGVGTCWILCWSPLSGVRVWLMSQAVLSPALYYTICPVNNAVDCLLLLLHFA